MCVIYCVLIKRSENCVNVILNNDMRYLLEMKEEDKNIFIVFLLNFRQVKDYIKIQIKFLKGNFVCVLFRDEIFC